MVLLIQDVKSLRSFQKGFGNNVLLTSWGTGLKFNNVSFAMAPHPQSFYSTNSHSCVLFAVKSLQMAWFSFQTQWNLLLIVVWGWSHRHLICRHPVLVANLNRLKHTHPRFAVISIFLARCWEFISKIQTGNLKWKIKLS